MIRSARWSLLWASLLTGCTCGGVAPEPAPSLDRTPAPVPEGWLFEVAVGGDEALARLRDVLPAEGPARALFPARARDLADAWVGAMPAPSATIDPDAPLRCIAMGRGADRDPAMACALGLVAGAGLEGRPGAPRGASWVDAGDRAAAVAGDVLVIAEDRATLEATLGWLAFTAMPEAPPRGLRVRVAEHVAGTLLRPALEQTIASEARGARANIARERAEHEAPPALGEPEAVVAWLEALAAERVALLPDLGEVTVTLDADAGGVAIDARAVVREGSPLARRLAEAGESPVRGLRELPEGVVLAWASVESEASREGSSAAIAERLAAIAGPRLAGREREAVEVALRAWADVRGDATVSAIGHDGRGAWAALASRPAQVPPVVPLRDALAVGWADAVLAAPLGCEHVRPRDTDFDDAITLCPGAHLARGAEGDATALVIAQGTLEDARARAQALAGRIAMGRAAIGASPDVERVLGGRDPEGTFFAALVVPSAAPALLAGIVPSMRAPEAAETPRGAPWALRAVREDGAVRLEVRASARAVADLLALVDSRAQE